MTGSTAASLALLPEKQRKAILADLTPDELEHLEWDWGFWGRPEQLPPEGDWKNWLFIAGRGAGKTRAGAEWVRSKVIEGHGIIGLIAPTAADARDVMVEGHSGLLSVCWKKDATRDGAPLGRPVYEPSKRKVTWANGAIAKLYSAEEPERLRGPQHFAVWADELCSWKYLQQTYDMSSFGLRLGENPQLMVTTTPKPVQVLRKLIKDPRSVISTGSTFDNAANLAPTFLEDIREKYEGTRLGRQELFAELLEDIPGALWTLSMFEEHRVEELPDMQRIVVAIDPSGTAGDEDDGDSVGIVVAGKGVDGRGYVLEDATCKLSPDGWGRRAVNAFRKHKADRIVAERNFGGAMVEHVIRTVDRKVPYREVTASRGKVVRAEPIAALYEQGRVSHVHGLSALEGQMVSMTGEGYMGDGSPDRLDAAVWALNDLMITPKIGGSTELQGMY